MKTSLKLALRLSVAQIFFVTQVFAQPYQEPVVPGTSPYYTSSMARKYSQAAGDSINIHDNGAICDGNSHPLSTVFNVFNNDAANFQDLVNHYPLLVAPNPRITTPYITVSNWKTMEADTAGIQNSIYTVSTVPGATNSVYTQTQAKSSVGSGVCFINKTLDFTQSQGRGISYDFSGTQLSCKTTGLPCMDYTGAAGNSFIGFNFIGGSSNTPSMATYCSRPGVAGLYGSSTYNTFYHLTANGKYTIGDFYKSGCEDLSVYDSFLRNTSTAAHVLIDDGQNKFNLCSQFYPTSGGTSGCLPFNSSTSDNGLTCIDCKLLQDGDSSDALWISRGQQVRFIAGYIHNIGNASPINQPAVVIDFSNNTINRSVYLDIHMEGGGSSLMGCAVRFQGASTIDMEALTLIDHNPQALNSIYCADIAGSFGTAVTSVAMNGAYTYLGSLNTSPQATYFDIPADYTYSGYFYGQNNSGYSAPSLITGTVCFGATCTGSSNVTMTTSSTNAITVVPQNSVTWSVVYGTGASIPSITETLTTDGTSKVYCIKYAMTFTPTFSTDSGQLRFSLPYTNPINVNTAFHINNSNAVPAGVTIEFGQPISNQAYFTIIKTTSGNLPSGTLSVGDISSGSTYTISGGGCYN